ncbi:Hypothetical Protein FCC1311_061922 [Hondaea fermentalgiana]|uniref:Uncharacterized protein n=1 Tax=Hondaea fermentalgiana TaxID=2315210 RepID=A0A2R5GGE0_9STRA|nr:Hypothetical Protein FCC1311_061922 [Hondaea fermentalgiana]|eukprot:GBG29972.1 Hypothetical Protein FCC1311_061922 [Hondaea fermentalgiana]
MASTRQEVEADFVGRVIGAASQGAAGAVVGAVLSSVTEPVVNRVLVKRQSLSEALAEVDLESIKKFFSTVVAANFIKFPFFEVVNILVGDLDLPDTAKGAVLGAVFTTATLPIGNYRFCKSMGMPVDMNSLYKAYLPTVARDVVYGVVRQNVGSYLAQAYPNLQKTTAGRFFATFFTVLAACIISAPGNEVRGYYLQPEDRRLPVKEFFKPDRFVRSTTIGGLIMSSALGVGSLVVGPATERFNAFKALLDANPVAKVMVGIFIAQQYLAAKRHTELISKLDSDAAKKNA